MKRTMFVICVALAVFAASQTALAAPSKPPAKSPPKKVASQPASTARAPVVLRKASPVSSNASAHLAPKATSQPASRSTVVTPAAPAAPVPSAAKPVASPQVVTASGPTVVQMVMPSNLATSQEVGALGTKLDAFMGEVRTMKQEISAVRKDVGLIRRELKVVSKKVEDLLSTVGPDSGWAKTQRDEAAKKAKEPERVGYLIWDSLCGEVHLRLNREGKLEVKLVKRGMTEWTDFTSVDNGVLSVIWGNYYHQIANDNNWLMSEVRKYRYKCQDE